MLVGLTGCAAYADDVVVFSDACESHVQCLHAVFDQLAGANLRVGLAKCEFAKATLNYREVCPVQAKAEAIDKYPVPAAKKEQGLAGYYFWLRLTS